MLPNSKCVTFLKYNVKNISLQERIPIRCAKCHMLANEQKEL